MTNQHDTDYETFLRDKFTHLPTVGFEDEITVPDAMFPHQAVGTKWALRRGRAALFFDTGLGKAITGLVWCQHVGTKGMVLLIAPLAVSEQFVQTEAPKFGIPAKIVEQMGDCEMGVVNITNYEKLHRFDLSAFVGVCLDESSILKSLDGKTKEMLIAAFASTPYRLALSATPSPNDHMELGNHAEFLGIMTRAEMLAMFFTHDGKDTSKWRVKEHGKNAFWAWVASWALMVKKPSDLGFDDSGYNLPALNIHEHVVEMPDSFHKEQHTLVPIEAKTLTERRAAKKASMGNRVEACASLAIDSPDTWLIWCHLNEEGDRLQKMIPGSVQIAGSDTPEDKKKRMLDFAAGKIRVLITKGKIAGFGMNWQNCHKQAFVGLNESHEQFYQCIRRSWRFGQKNDVDVHLFLSEAETNTLRDLRRKEQAASDMSEAMVKATRAIAHEAVTGAKKEPTAYQEDVARGKRYTFYLGDSCKAIQNCGDESIDYTIFSPPFVSLYVFSDSERDMGNCRSNDEFYQHFRYLVREIHRTTKPGRLCSFHCMDLPTLKHREGYIGLIDFGGLLLKAFQDEGWIFHSKVVINKDPVVAMQRTKAKGLLWKNLRGDSTDSRQGIPDYLINVQKPGDVEVPILGDYASALAGIAELIEGGPVSLANHRALDLYLRMYAETMPSVMTTMRKRGENAVAVKHTAEEFPVTRWQRIASPVWNDIDQSDTLQYRSAREEGDDRHICPLQVEVVRRGIEMYSNPGETVASWFGGIATEGVVALEMGREAVLCELKKSYWKVGARNLSETETGAKQVGFDF